MRLWTGPSPERPKRSRRDVLIVGCAALIQACARRNTTASGLLEQIKARGTIHVPTEVAFEPCEFVENGKIRPTAKT